MVGQHKFVLGQIDSASVLGRFIGNFMDSSYFFTKAQQILTFSPYIMVVIFIIALLALSSYEVCSFTFNRVSNLSVLGKSCFQLEHSNVILYGSGKPVEVTFQPSGKVIMAEQGDKIEDIAKKNGVNIPFKCKQVEYLSHQ